MTTEELKNFIDFLRSNGVAHYKGGVPCKAGEVLGEEVELLLHDEAPVQTAAPEETKKPELSTPAPRGADGLTAEEQEDLYGRVLDAPRS